MNEPLVEFSRLSRRYRQGRATVLALDAASGRIMPGNRIAIVGASGSGKSTLLHLLGGLDAPDAGEIAWPALGPSASLRPSKLAMVFQASSLIPYLSVFENVALPLVLHGRNHMLRTAALAALRQFDLEALADRLPQEISGGQAQRVAAARATIGDVRLILADEPTGQLDRATARTLMDTLLEYAAARCTALVVATHDRQVAERLETVWHIRHGVLASPCSEP